MKDFQTLQQSLINAKKVMNKVDGGEFSKTNLNSSSISIDRDTSLKQQFF